MRLARENRGSNQSQNKGGFGAAKSGGNASSGFAARFANKISVVTREGSTEKLSTGSSSAIHHSSSQYRGAGRDEGFTVHQQPYPGEIKPPPIDGTSVGSMSTGGRRRLTAAALRSRAAATTASQGTNEANNEWVAQYRAQLGETPGAPGGESWLMKEQPFHRRGLDRVAPGASVHVPVEPEAGRVHPAFLARSGTSVFGGFNSMESNGTDPSTRDDGLMYYSVAQPLPEGPKPEGYEEAMAEWEAQQAAAAAAEAAANGDGTSSNGGPRGRHGERIRTGKDMLAYSAAPRGVEWRPYTVKDFKEKHATLMKELPSSLAPNKKDEEYEKKRALAEKRKEYGRSLTMVNRHLLRQQAEARRHATGSSMIQKASAYDTSKTARAKAYASVALPKPAPRPTSAEQRRAAEREASRNDPLYEGPKVKAIHGRLEAMEAKNLEDREQVAAIRQSLAQARQNRY